MTLPDKSRKESPRERFRNILSAEQDEEAAREPRKPTVVNLPKIGQGGQPATGSARAANEGEAVDVRGGRGAQMLPAFWTIGGILSVIANVLLVGMLLGGRGLSGGGEEVLSNVYASLDQLDNAHIRATIPLRTNLALDATVPLEASTRITLAQDLFVRGAHVTINASGLSIDSPADITLPAGTEMNVNLDLALPLQSALPVTADVPVDIALRDTELHAAIQGLKDSLRPVVCANSPAATLPDGTSICR